MKFSYRKSNVKGRGKEEKRLKQHDIRAQREVVRKASIRMRLVRCDGKEVGVFDMPNPNRYDILSISIFCKIPLSIFSRMAISIFFKLSLSISESISIFSKFPYRYFYRYRYFPNFLIDIFSISIFSK